MVELNPRIPVQPTLFLCFLAGQRIQDDQYPFHGQENQDGCNKGSSQSLALEFASKKQYPLGVVYCKVIRNRFQAFV